MPGKKKPKIPSNPADCADLLYTTREKRLALQKDITAYEELETALKEYFINTMSKKSTGISGSVANVQLEKKVIPTVEDWPKFYAHIKKTGQWDLMQKRVADTAVQERWDAKKEVPGVGRFNVIKVSCTKLKKNVKGIRGKRK